MRKIKDFIVASLTCFSIIVIVFTNIAGPIHAFRKHGKDDFWLSIYVPPYGWYRGIEMFWHKD
jgi:hypothetical protein